MLASLTPPLALILIIIISKYSIRIALQTPVTDALHRYSALLSINTS